ncbi:conserved protein of unknown function [Nitrospira japonica]|uniref:Uncharacterized protein n=1 Tax=Nitrospira japonica TaxID=1325564 RepID=A0A1W1I8Y6_9BACT|nr:hypothetical protein [Nitrospira japonica]SLM49391.1 conserved protein of unknown function [Nitrospira japonica]
MRNALMARRWGWGIVIGLWGVLLYGCTTPEQPPTLLAPTEAQLKIRNFQTRVFDMTDRNFAIRSVIGSLQDLGFIIERANDVLGLVTAARFAEPNYYDVVTITVTVRQLNATQLTIRANAIYNNRPIEDPKVYQNFFFTLERSLFITKESPTAP